MSVNRLICGYFTIDVSEFKEGGELEEVKYICAGSLTAAYVPLVHHLGNDADENEIVIHIRKAAKEADFNHPDAPITPGMPRWLSLLRFASNAIMKAFQNANPQRPLPSASFDNHIKGVYNELATMKQQMARMEQKLDDREGDKETIASLKEGRQILSKELATKSKLCEEKDKEIARLKRHLRSHSSTIETMAAAQGSLFKSPDKSTASLPLSDNTTMVLSPIKPSSQLDLAEESTTTSSSLSCPPSTDPPSEEKTQQSAMEIVDESSERSQKKQKRQVTSASNSSASRPLNLTGIQVTQRKKKINLQGELKRLYNEGILKAKIASALSNDETVTKRALFDNNCDYYIGMNNSS